MSANVRDHDPRRDSGYTSVRSSGPESPAPPPQLLVSGLTLMHSGSFRETLDSRKEV